MARSIESPGHHLAPALAALDHPVIETQIPLAE
jgi:hypothetical protein